MAPKVLAMCTVCQKESLHFTRRAGQVQSKCILCRRATAREDYRRKVAEDPTYRARKAEQKRRRRAAGYRYDYRTVSPIDYYCTAMLSSARRTAKRKNLDFSLTPAWLKARLQQGLCAATGLPLDFSAPNGSNCNPRAPSIDRIDSTAGYTPENCQLVMTWYKSRKTTTTSKPSSP